LYYFIAPEVAGGWGEGTEADTSVHPPLVRKLHYHFDDWLGDDLLETFPCFIVTDKLRKDIIDSGLTGVEFDNVLISRSDEFELPGCVVEFPKFHWMKVEKSDRLVDFRISEDGRLMVSEVALAALKRHSMSYADVDPA
jgi:hypothetical protein